MLEIIERVIGNLMDPRIMDKKIEEAIAELEAWIQRDGSV